MTGAESHFTAEALGEPEGPGRYVNIDSMAPVYAMYCDAALRFLR